VDQETKEHLERISKKIGVTKSRLAGNLLQIGLDDARTMENLGVLQAAIVLRDVKKRFRARMEATEAALQEA